MGATDFGIRYVTVDGDDANDGKTWDSSLLTVATAVDSLPAVGSGKQRRHAGKVNIGAGLFDENRKIEYNSNLNIVGVGTGGTARGDSQGGTMIRRAHDGDLFGPSAEFTDWGHHLRMSSLTLHGNRTNFPEPADLVRLPPPGFNTAFRDVMFTQSSRYAVRVTYNAVNLYFYNCTGSVLEGFLHFTLKPSANLCNVALFGTQLDNCGPYPIHIVNDTYGDANNVMIYGLETEATRPGQHDSVINVETLPGAGNPVWLTVDGVSAFRARSIGKGDTVLAATGDGTKRPRWAMRNIHGSGYKRAFHDLRTGAGSVSPLRNHLTQAVYPAGESEIGAV